MKAIITSSKESNGQYINRIDFTDKIKDKSLGGTMNVTKRFYFASDEARTIDEELPLFKPADWNVRSSIYTYTDEETGEVKQAESVWLVDRK